MRRSISTCSSPGGVEAAKTFDAIDGALRAVQGALKADGQRGKSRVDQKSMASECSVNEDVESLCGTECTESTAFPESICGTDCCLSEDGSSSIAGGFQLSPSLQDARRSMKERMRSEERSARFTRGLLAKLDEIRELVTSTESETA